MGMDLEGASGNYFRANIWSWRVINALCLEVNAEDKLNLDLIGWEYNDGAGLSSQEECNKLADAIQKRLDTGLREFVLETGSGLRVNNEGVFCEKGKSPYYASSELIAKFVKFLQECGGKFSIY